MQLCQSPNFTRTSPNHLMFGRDVNTNLSLLRPETKGTTNLNEVVGTRRQLKTGDASKKLRQHEDLEMEPWAYSRKRGQFTVKCQNGQWTVSLQV